jgi:signal transduction histidine kinase
LRSRSRASVAPGAQRPKKSLTAVASAAARPLAGVIDAATLAWDADGVVRGAAGSCDKVFERVASELRGRKLTQLFEDSGALQDALQFGIARSLRLAGGRQVRVEAAPCEGGAVAVVRGRSNDELDLARLVSSLGHELRNAFASVLLAVQSLERHEPGMSERGRRRLQLAARELHRIDGVLRGLQEIGRTPPSRLVTAVPERLVREALEALSGELGDRGVHIEAPDGDGDAAQLDAPRVRLAIEELIRGALRGSPTGQTVLVTVERREGELAFAVIAAARPGSGSGPDLGLAVVEGVARAHGGHVERRSEEDTERLALVLPRRELIR